MGPWSRSPGSWRVARIVPTPVGRETGSIRVAFSSTQTFPVSESNRCPGVPPAWTAAISASTSPVAGRCAFRLPRRPHLGRGLTIAMDRTSGKSGPVVATHRAKAEDGAEARCCRLERRLPRRGQLRARQGGSGDDGGQRRRPGPSRSHAPARPGARSCQGTLSFTCLQAGRTKAAAYGQVAVERQVDASPLPGRMVDAGRKFE